MLRLFLFACPFADPRGSVRLDANTCVIFSASSRVSRCRRASAALLGANETWAEQSCGSAHSRISTTCLRKLFDLKVSVVLFMYTIGDELSAPTRCVHCALWEGRQSEVKVLRKKENWPIPFSELERVTTAAFCLILIKYLVRYKSTNSTSSYSYVSLTLYEILEVREIQSVSVSRLSG